MSGGRPERSPLAVLVLVMIGIAIAASCIAGAYYVAVDLPAQKSVQPPTNQLGDEVCIKCMAKCQLKLYNPDSYTACVNSCSSCECAPFKCERADE